MDALFLPLRGNYLVYGCADGLIEGEVTLSRLALHIVANCSLVLAASPEITWESLEDWRSSSFSE